MSNQRVFDMELVKVESLENAVRTPFYQTDSTGGSVWIMILLRLINMKALYSIFLSCDRDIFIL